VLLPDVVKGPQPADEVVRVLIDSTPQGATITRAGKSGSVGTTPTELKLKRGEASFDVLLTLDGFQSQTRTVTAERDRDFLIPLSKIEAPPPLVDNDKAARTPHPADTHHGHHGHDAKPPSNHGTDPDGVLAPKL
jgi:hypothetical protein